MTVEIVECEQGDEAWVKARLGVPTASEFSTIMAVGARGGESSTRRLYMNQLVGEIITGQPSDGAFTSRHTMRGKEKEPEGADAYAFINGIELQRVGFIKNSGLIRAAIGCSPDRLIGNDGGLEIKSGLAHVVVDAIRRDVFPSEHMAQCMGSLWVTEREWWDLVIYAEGLPLFQKRVYRDDIYVRRLKETVEQFHVHLMQAVEYVRRYG